MTRAFQQEQTLVEVSVVVPIHNEEESVAALTQQVLDVFARENKTAELILVNDGSTDKSAEMIAEAQKKHPQIVGVFLARNYGQTAAMQAGFDHAKGAIVVTLDGDLQNDPADIPRLLKLLEDDQADVVAGWRRDRKDGFVRVLFSKLANRLIGQVTRIQIRDNGCTLKAFRRDMLDRIRIYGELHRFLPSVLADVGARIVEIDVNHRPRLHGRSKYGLDRTFRVLLDLFLINFMQRYLFRPLHFFGGFGLLALIPGGLIFLYLSLAWLFTNEELAQRPLFLLSMFLMLTGVSFIGQGLLAEMLTRLLHESTSRKQYQLVLRQPQAQSDASVPPVHESG